MYYYSRQIIIMCVILAVFGIAKQCIAERQTRKNRKIELARTLMDNAYKDISGFMIPSEESALIAQKNADSTYGEITFESLQTILDELPVGREDVFYDLGSGVGKVCVQVALTTPAKRIVGVELSPTRYKHAIGVEKKLVQEKHIHPFRLEFQEKNITDVQLHEATIIFMLSTCFSDQLMHNIIQKIITIQHHPVKIITQKKLWDEKYFTLVKQYCLPMSWSESVPIYIYRLQRT